MDIWKRLFGAKSATELVKHPGDLHSSKEEKLAESSLDASGEFALGVQNAKEGELHSALAAFDRALKLNPDFAQAL